MIIKNRDKLFKAAKKLGLTVDHKKQKFKANRYTTAIDVDAVIKGKGGAIGVVAKGSDEYELMYDSYDWVRSMHNTVGSSCNKLTREYTQSIVEDEMTLVGGFIQDTEVKDSGEVHLTVSI